MATRDFRTGIGWSRRGGKGSKIKRLHSPHWKLLLFILAVTVVSSSYLKSREKEKINKWDNYEANEKDCSSNTCLKKKKKKLLHVDGSEIAQLRNLSCGYVFGTHHIFSSTHQHPRLLVASPFCFLCLLVRLSKRVLSWHVRCSDNIM